MSNDWKVATQRVVQKMELVFRNRFRALAGALLLSSALLTAQRASQTNASFLNDVTIHAGRIRLDNLLAPGASKQLRAALGSIDLGPAPQPGSFRVFTSAELRHAAGDGTTLALDFPTQVIVRSAGSPVSAQSIASALSAAKLPSENVHLLGAPVTRAPDAALEAAVTQSGPDGDTFLVRFSCRIRSECSPFWGEIHVQEPILLPGPQRNPALVPARITVPLVTPGHPALLICDQPGMEIRLRVRPLKPAGLGERVKVVDPDTRRVFFARVKAKDVVASDLEEAR